DCVIHNSSFVVHRHHDERGIVVEFSSTRPADGVLDLLLDFGGRKCAVFLYERKQPVVAELLAVASLSLRNTVGKEQYPVAGCERDFALFEGPILDGAKRGAAIRQAQERAVAARQDGGVLPGIR